MSVKLIKGMGWKRQIEIEKNIILSTRFQLELGSSRADLWEVNNRVWLKQGVKVRLVSVTQLAPAGKWCKYNIWQQEASSFSSSTDIQPKLCTVWYCI